MSYLNKAITITTEAFDGVVDKAGRPYILHCYEVMRGVLHHNDDELSAAAFMHDLIEDTDWTIEMLREAGFSEDIVQTVEALTKKKGGSYDTYIYGLVFNPMAVKIKMSDLRHNMDTLRLDSLDDKGLQRLKKYHKTYKYLEGFV